MNVSNLRLPVFQVFSEALSVADESRIRTRERTGVDWTAFVGKFAKSLLLKKSKKLGEGKFEQIDDSNFGKRKYYRGDHVEGQWVQDGRKCFLL